MKNTVQDYVYKSRNLAGRPSGHTNDPERCQFEVAEVGRMTTWHQCSRRFVEEIDGYGFCKQHVAEVKRGLRLSEANLVRYVAKFRNGEPELARVFAESETDKTITIINSEVILGSYVYIPSGRQNKSQFNLFEEESEAAAWLLQESVEYYSGLIERTKQAQETVKNMEAMVKNES